MSYEITKEKDQTDAMIMQSIPFFSIFRLTWEQSKRFKAH